MKERDLARWTTALLSAGGFAVAWYLMEMHIQASVGQAVGGALCGAHSVVDCAAAAQSRYSLLFGMPIALLGQCFYAAVFALALFDRQKVRDSDQPFRPGAIASTLFGVGMIYSLFLAGVSIVEIKSLCPFCVMLYVVNLMGFVAAAMWAGEKPHQVIKSQLKSPSGFFNGWTGLFAMTFGFILLVGTQVVDTSIRDRLREQARVMEQSGQELTQVEESLYRADHSPGKGPVDAPVHIVKFSNFPCPYCGALAGVLDQISEEFGDDVRVEYRHLPLPSQVDGAGSAYAAQCADEQGRFWEMHDALFASAPELDPQSIRGLVERLELDSDAFEECMQSERPRETVDTDIEAGRLLDIDGTPVFFLNGYRFEGALGLDLMRPLVAEAIAEHKE